MALEADISHLSIRERTVYHEIMAGLHTASQMLEAEGGADVVADLDDTAATINELPEPSRERVLVAIGANEDVAKAYRQLLADIGYENLEARRPGARP